MVLPFSCRSNVKDGTFATLLLFTVGNQELLHNFPTGFVEIGLLLKTEMEDTFIILGKKLRDFKV
jgi:hypothetical protein